MWYVYFIRQAQKKGNCPIKIGVSKDPDYRLKRLQTGNPNKLEVIAAIPFDIEKDAYTMERSLHWIAENKYQRLIGEWFMIYGGWKGLVEDAYKSSGLFPKGSK